MYDKRTDPMRVTENVVRAEITALNERGQFPKPYHLVKQGAFAAGGDDNYASVRVVCLTDEPVFEDSPFSVHLAVLVADGEPEHVSVKLINGVYDLTVEQAAEEL